MLHLSVSATNYQYLTMYFPSSRMHVRLDKESSKLTTMITPFGRYWWKRLPFGLKVSSEIFQRKLDEALGGLEGVFSVVDDVVVAGCGQTMEEAQIDDQQKLTKTLKRCAEKKHCPE